MMSSNDYPFAVLMRILVANQVLNDLDHLLRGFPYHNDENPNFIFPQRIVLF